MYPRFCFDSARCVALVSRLDPGHSGSESSEHVRQVPHCACCSHALLPTAVCSIQLCSMLLAMLRPREASLRLRWRQRPAPLKGMPLIPPAGWLALLALAAGSGRQVWALHASDSSKAADAVFAGGGSLNPRLRIEHSGQGASFLVTGRIVKGQVSSSSALSGWERPCRAAWSQRGRKTVQTAPLAMAASLAHGGDPAKRTPYPTFVIVRRGAGALGGSG